MEMADKASFSIDVGRRRVLAKDNRGLVRRSQANCRILMGIIITVLLYASPTRGEQPSDLYNKVVSFYFGWWGNPQVSGQWVHWKNVDPANERIENSAHFPA